jgi:hypothetical protein
MNEQNSKTLTEKYKYMFVEMVRSSEILKKQNEITNEYTIANANDDEILKAFLKEEQKEVGAYYPIAFGFECDDGWFRILDELMGRIQEVDKDKIVVIYQVKEKFGGLRFNPGSSTEEVNNIIEEYEKKSYEVCEVCGEEGELCEDHHWYKTVCEKHRQIESWSGLKQNYKPVKK